jgi:hypothetical protein
LAGFDPITIGQLLIQSSLTGFEVTIEDRPLLLIHGDPTIQITTQLSANGATTG